MQLSPKPYMPSTHHYGTNYTTSDAARKPILAGCRRKARGRPQALRSRSALPRLLAQTLPPTWGSDFCRRQVACEPTHSGGDSSPPRTKPCPHLAYRIRKTCDKDINPTSADCLPPIRQVWREFHMAEPAEKKCHCRPSHRHEHERRVCINSR